MVFEVCYFGVLFAYQYIYLCKKKKEKYSIDVMQLRCFYAVHNAWRNNQWLFNPFSLGDSITNKHQQYNRKENTTMSAVPQRAQHFFHHSVTLTISNHRYAFNPSYLHVFHPSASFLRCFALTKPEKKNYKLFQNYIALFMHIQFFFSCLHCFSNCSDYSNI